MHDTNILAALIQRKHECIVQLCALGQRQWTAIQDANMTQVLDVLALKQRVLTELQRMERLMEPYRHESPEERQWSTPELRERCAGQQQECEQMLQEIVQQEKVSEQEMIRRRDEAAARLEGFHQTRQVNDAYKAAPPEGVRRLDLSSDA